MRSKRVECSTLTKSASKILSSSSADLLVVPAASPGPVGSACLLQYSMTLTRMWEVTLGSGMPLSAQPSSIIFLRVIDCIATDSFTSNSWLSLLRSISIFSFTFSATAIDLLASPSDVLESRWICSRGAVAVFRIPGEGIQRVQAAKKEPGGHAAAPKRLPRFLICWRVLFWRAQAHGPRSWLSATVTRYGLLEHYFTVHYTIRSRVKFKYENSNK
jgi:hypothetical protein